MKLKNKRTGEIGELQVTEKHCAVAVGNGTASCGIEIYSSLAQLFKEWEDVPEEPKKYWFIENDGDVSSIGVDEDFAESLRASKEIGNYFESKEEAKQAVKKLKAFKRLKDKGFRFKDYTRNFDGFKRVDGSVFIVAELDDEGTIGMIDELNICFGGEE